MLLNCCYFYFNIDRSVITERKKIICFVISQSVIEAVRLDNKEWATLCLWILKFSGCSEDLSQLVGIPMGFYRST